MTSNKDTVNMHLAALVRDFIIYVDHECFEHPDELQRFLGDSSQYLRRYNRKVVVNTDYVTGAQKTLSDESKLHASMQRIENSGRLERLDSEDIETAISTLLEKDNVLLITQDRPLADAVFGAPRFQELTQLYIKTIAETAEMQDFPGIRPKKSVPLGNSPMQAATIRHIVIDISSLKFEWTSFFLEDLSAPMVLNQHLFTIYVLNRQLEEARKEGEISRAVHRIYGHFNHENTAEVRDELRFKNDEKAIQKLRTQGNVAVLTFTPARAGVFFNFNDADLSGRAVLPVSYSDGRITADFQCPWRRDILALFEHLAGEVKEDSFDKYEKIAEKEKIASAQEESKSILVSSERVGALLKNQKREPDDGSVVTPMNKPVDSVQIDIPEAQEVVNPGLAAPHVDMGTIDPDKGVSGQMDAIIPNVPRQKSKRPFDPVSGMFDTGRSSHSQKNKSRTVSLFGDEDSRRKPVTGFREGFEDNAARNAEPASAAVPEPSPAVAPSPAPLPERPVRKDFGKVAEVAQAAVTAIENSDFLRAEVNPDPLLTATGVNPAPRNTGSSSADDLITESFVSLNPVEVAPIESGDAFTGEGIEIEDLAQEGRKRQEKMEKEQSERLSRPGRVIKPIAPPDPALEKRSRAPESSSPLSGSGRIAAPAASLNPDGMIQNPNAPALGGVSGPGAGASERTGILNPGAPSLGGFSGSSAVSGERTGILNPGAPSLSGISGSSAVSGERTGILNPGAPSLGGFSGSSTVSSERTGILNPEAPSLGGFSGSSTVSSERTGILNPGAPSLGGTSSAESGRIDPLPLRNPEAPPLEPISSANAAPAPQEVPAETAADSVTGKTLLEDTAPDAAVTAPDPEFGASSEAPEDPELMKSFAALRAGFRSRKENPAASEPSAPVSGEVPEETVSSGEPEEGAHSASEPETISGPEPAHIPAEPEAEIPSPKAPEAGPEPVSASESAPEEASLPDEVPAQESSSGKDNLINALLGQKESAADPATETAGAALTSAEPAPEGVSPFSAPEETPEAGTLSGEEKPSGKDTLINALLGQKETPEDPASEETESAPLTSAAPASEAASPVSDPEEASQDDTLSGEAKLSRKDDLINTLLGRKSSSLQPGTETETAASLAPEPEAETVPSASTEQDSASDSLDDDLLVAADAPDSRPAAAEDDSASGSAPETTPGAPEFSSKADLLKSLAGTAAKAGNSGSSSGGNGASKPASSGAFNMETFLGRKIPKPVKKKVEEETENAYGHRNLKLKGSAVGFTLPPEQQARLEKRREQERLQREAEEKARLEQEQAAIRMREALDRSRSEELKKNAKSCSEVPESELVVKDTLNPVMPEGRQLNSGKPDVALMGVQDDTPDELAITEEEARLREKYRAEEERLAREEAARNAPRINKEELFQDLMKKNSSIKEQREEAEKEAKKERKRSILDKFKKKNEEMENKQRSRAELDSVEPPAQPAGGVRTEKAEKNGRSIELSGNTTGFTLNQDQMDAIEKHRAELRDIEEKERLQKLEWQKPKEKHDPTNFQLTEQASVFKMNEEDNEKFARKREINKMARGDAAVAEKERQEKEHEELIRQINTVKAIEEYDLDGRTSDFVFDPSQAKTSGSADLEDFVMTPERQEKLRRFEASQRPEVEVKRDLGGASMFRSEEGMVKKRRAGTGRRTGAITGFDAGLLSDQRQKVVHAATNEERSVQDLAAVDRAIMERVNALNQQSSEQPKPQIRTTVTQAVESRTVEVVAQRSLSSGAHVSLDVSREAPDNSELAVQTASRAPVPESEAPESSQVTLDPHAAVESRTTVAETHVFGYTGKPYKPPVDLGIISIPTFGDTVIINNQRRTLDRPLVMSQSLAIFENDENTVIRIFGNSVLNANMIAKLLAMIETPVSMKGIDWPLTLAKNESGDIVGCVLSKENTSSLQSLCKSLDSSSFVIINRKNLVKMAISLVEKVVALNKMKIFIGEGDMNSIVVDGDDEVSFVNMERCQIGDYLYTRMSSGIVPPELNDEEQNCADELSDRYVVAEALFRMFFLGRAPYVMSRRQGVLENQYSAFRFPTNYYDEMTAPKDISLYIWSFFPEYIRKAFIDTLNYGYHNRELRVDCLRWLFFLKRWLEDFEQDKLSPMAYEIKPSRMNIGNSSEMVPCKICRCPVTKTEAVATDGLCHHCFTTRGKMHVCDCCNREFMVSYRDLMVGSEESRSICHDCRVKFHRINAIVKCHSCSRNYTVSDGDLTMFGERVYSTCPDCMKKIRAREALGLAGTPEMTEPLKRPGTRDVINALMAGKNGGTAQKAADNSENPAS